MWILGTVGDFSVCLKQYNSGSKWGINNGRISKQEMRKDDVIVANYDRGWDIKPEGEEAQAALAVILEEFN